MKVRKRNGAEVPFDSSKIERAISRANASVSPTEQLTERQITRIVGKTVKHCTTADHAITVEEVQDYIEDRIMEVDKFTLARVYDRYRFLRTLARKENSTDSSVLSLIEYDNETVKQENSNKNPRINSVQRDYMAGEVSKDLSERILLPSDVVEAHKEGIIHFHDLDYFAQHMHNCDLINLEDMLQNGTVISDVMIETPKSFSTACNITTQIIAQVASSQYGGQSFSLAHLAPFVDVSRQKIKRRLHHLAHDTGVVFTDEQLAQFTDKWLKNDITAGIQTIQYQLVTLMTTNGQTPFVTMYMNINEAPEGQVRDDLVTLIQEVLRQRLMGIKNKDGIYVTPAFPKLIYVLDENNITPGSDYYAVTKLAAQCTAKRMVPDYISAKVMRELKHDNVYTCMGCRSFLTVADKIRNEDGSHKFYGRFNQGVVTINLVDAALSSQKDLTKFWEIMEERLELCHRALQCRHKRLRGTKSDVAPILWQHGALARLAPGETIDKLLFDGYSTISLGYAGLYECIKYLTGKSHTDPEASPLAMQVMQKLNDKCAEWKAAENIDYSVYGTPLESTTYKFAQCLQRRFGVIPGVTDKEYITNSYHVHVSEHIDAFSKLDFEAPFQKLSPGGAISYVEVPDMKGNLDAVLALLRHIYNDIMYAELNSKSDYCSCCGFDGEIKIVTDDDGKLVWECPVCGNRDQSKMSVARRTCGYIGTQFWNQGRTQEIMDRVLHL